VTTVHLRDGDEIKAGKTILRVNVTESLPTTISSATPHRRRPAAAHAGSACLRRDSGSAGHTLPIPVRPVPVAVVPVIVPPASRPALTPVFRVQPGLSCVRCAPCGGGNAGSPLCAACEEQARKQPQQIPAIASSANWVGRHGRGLPRSAQRRWSSRRRQNDHPGGTPSPLDLQRFLREANILRTSSIRTSCPFRRWRDKRLLYFTMEYVQEWTLTRHCGAGASAGAARGELGWQLLQALEHAHGLGFVHRTSNRQPDADGESQGETLKLSDFGLARSTRRLP